MLIRPSENEYLPAAQTYIDLVPDGNLLEILKSQMEQTKRLLAGLSEQQSLFKYAQDKWTIKSVVGHISDVERLWNYRILRIVRNDVRELPGYDRDVFAQEAPFHDMALQDVMDDMVAVRMSTLTLLHPLPESVFIRYGEFNGQRLSARAAAYIIAGHEAHHMNVIRTRYIPNL
ncbi:DinB family protein [Paenibacillus sp. GCM10023252]|uniref:DinB family protein n=1 Tax=Paenibacillus sp. GCM10023252 TaxID=3252649 RepID=UPI00361F549A